MIGATAQYTFTTIGNKVVKLNADSGVCHLEHTETVPVVLESVCDTGGTGILNIFDNFSGTVEIFPNPSAGEFDILFSDFQNADLTVTIYGMNGQQVYKNQLTVNGSETLDLDMKKLANGNYLIKVDDGEGITTQKLSLMK